MVPAENCIASDFASYLRLGDTSPALGTRNYVTETRQSKPQIAMGYTPQQNRLRESDDSTEKLAAATVCASLENRQELVAPLYRPREVNCCWQ